MLDAAYVLDTTELPTYATANDVFDIWNIEDSHFWMLNNEAQVWIMEN